jgi:hypothetical protein
LLTDGNTDISISRTVYLSLIVMNPVHRTLALGIAVFLLVIAPVAATQELVRDSFTPNPPLVAGGQQHVMATYMIASGTSFPKNHELQMTTNLTGASWNIQVTLDGHNTATQTAAGSAAFVSGELLSYSANHDVSFIVTIDGVVPRTSGGQVTALQVEEIDNTGNLVPGSVSTISQPVAGEPTDPAGTTVPSLTPPVVTTTPATKSPGLSPAVCSIAIALAGIAALRRGPLYP